VHCHLASTRKVNFGLRFGGKRRKNKKFQKAIDKRYTAWYNTGAKKQSVPRSHPAATERAWLIGTPFWVHFVVRAYALRDFLFHRVTPGNGGTVLLAPRKNC